MIPEATSAGQSRALMEEHKRADSWPEDDFHQTRFARLQPPEPGRPSDRGATAEINESISTLPSAINSRQAGYSPAEEQEPNKVSCRVTAACNGKSTDCEVAHHSKGTSLSEGIDRSAQRRCYSDHFIGQIRAMPARQPEHFARHIHLVGFQEDV
jgi:hypothetical protein